MIKYHKTKKAAHALRERPQYDTIEPPHAVIV